MWCCSRLRSTFDVSVWEFFVSVGGRCSRLVMAKVMTVIGIRGIWRRCGGCVGVGVDGLRLVPSMLEVFVDQLVDCVGGVRFRVSVAGGSGSLRVIFAAGEALPADLVVGRGACR